MRSIADALVIGAGPAGCASAILLAQAGWQVILSEQSAYPRQKVCGECITAGSLELFDSLGVGEAFRAMAGPELFRVGWMSGQPLLAADFPACPAGAYRYGRAAGRDRLDALLLDRARASGVEVLQPAKVRAVRGGPGDFAADIEMRPRGSSPAGRAPKRLQRRFARAVIDAHGSWESAPPLCSGHGGATSPSGPRICSPSRRVSRTRAFPPGFCPSSRCTAGTAAWWLPRGAERPSPAAFAATGCVIAASRCRAPRPATLWPRSCIARAPECAMLSATRVSSARGSASGPIRPGIRVRGCVRTSSESAMRPERVTR